MGFFGFSSKKEVEEKERQARIQARESLLNSQRTSLSNLSKGSTVEFSVPYFDVFDPRFMDFGVPVSVRGSIVYGIDDINRFNSINKTQAYNDEIFAEKLRDALAKYIKSVVTNAPADYQIQVLQLERKIVEISALIQNIVTPQIERLFGINVRSLDVREITVKKSSRGYRELKSVTSDLEGDSLRRRHEMTLGGQEEMQRMQLENQKEIMRIQREEMQRGARLQTETNFLAAHQANLNAHVGVAQASMPKMPQMGMAGMPPMPGMNAVPQVQYMVNVNNQPYGPCDWDTLKQLVQAGQLTHQTPVWKQGMPQWEQAGTVQELTPLFNGGNMY